MTKNKITVAAIDKALVTFTTDRDKLRDAAHAIGMMIFYHAAPKEVSDECNGTGDCTRAAKLVSAMPRGWADLMKLWFTTYSPIRISTDGSNAGYDAKYSKLTPEEKLSWWKVEEANVNRFDTLKPGGANGVTILDFDDIENMLKRLAKQINNIADDEDDRRVLKPEDKARAKVLAGMLDNLRRVPISVPANEEQPVGEAAVA